MNPLLAPPREAKARQDLEIESLEQTFEHRAECQSNHAHNRDTCSGDVTAKISRNCGGDQIVCRNAEVASEEAIVMQTYHCGYCEGHIENCWTIRPI